MDLSAGRERISDPWEHLANKNPFVGFLDTLLRGSGQVMFQNNPLAGLLFLIGIFVNSALLGLAGLIGLVVSTLTAVILSADRSSIRAGLFGYWRRSQTLSKFAMHFLRGSRMLSAVSYQRIVKE